MGSSVHVYNKNKDILILGKESTDGLDDTTLTAKKKYSTNLTNYDKKFCLILHYNGENSYIFVKDVEIHKFKVEDSEIKLAPLFLGSVFQLII